MSPTDFRRLQQTMATDPWKPAHPDTYWNTQEDQDPLDSWLDQNPEPVDSTELHETEYIPLEDLSEDYFPNTIKSPKENPPKPRLKSYTRKAALIALLQVPVIAILAGLSLTGKIFLGLTLGLMAGATTTSAILVAYFLFSLAWRRN